MAKCILLGSGGSSIDEDVLTATPPKVIKSLTFLGAGSDEPQTGTLEINYANIAVGVTILGKTGTYTGKGNAGPGQVLKGYTASNKDTSNFAGTLPNKGLLNDTNVTINYSKTLDTGYYSSIKVTQNLSIWQAPSNSAGVITAYGGANNGVVINDNTRGRGIAVRIQNNARLMGANWVFLAMPNIKPENIRSGISIFGIEGTAKSPFPDSDVLLYDAGTWMNDAVNGARFKCLEMYESYPNGNTTWEAEHNEYINYGNTVPGSTVTNGRYDRWELYTDYNDYSSPDIVYTYNGYGGEGYVYEYGYLDEFGRWRDVNGMIFDKFQEQPGFKIFLDVPASSGVKRGQSRIDCFYPGDSVLHDPLIGKNLQGYMLDNSFNFYKCGGPNGLYYQDQFTFRYFIHVDKDDPDYPMADYTGLRYRDIYQTARRPGFYAYMDHRSRHYVQEWDTFVNLNDPIDITKYVQIKINYYLVWNHCNAGLAASYSKYNYDMVCYVGISREYYDEERGRTRTEYKSERMYLGEANTKWDDRHSENGTTCLNCPGYLNVGSSQCNIPAITIDRSGKSKYYLQLHFYGANDGDKVNTPFKAKLIVTGIKLIPGEKCSVDLGTLVPYAKATRGSSKTINNIRTYDYTYTDPIGVENNAIYYDIYGRDTVYGDPAGKTGHCPWFEGYNGKLDPFVIYKRGNEYFLENYTTSKSEEIVLDKRFIPSKKGKLYRVVEFYTYVYRNPTTYSGAKMGIYSSVDFYACNGYNSMEKLDQLYIDITTNKIYSYIKIVGTVRTTWSGRRYNLSIDFNQSTLARKTVGKVYRVNMIKNESYFLSSRFNIIINYDDEIVAYTLAPYSRMKTFYGYMKCTGDGSTFEYVRSWDYPTPEDNPIAHRVYEIR